MKLKGCASKWGPGSTPRMCFLCKEVAHTFASSLHQWAVQDSNLRCGTGYPVSGLQPDAFAARGTDPRGCYSVVGVPVTGIEPATLGLEVPRSVR